MWERSNQLWAHVGGINSRRHGQVPECPWKACREFIQPVHDRCILAHQSRSGVGSVSSASRMMPAGASAASLTATLCPFSSVYPAPMVYSTSKSKHFSQESALQERACGAESCRDRDLLEELATVLLTIEIQYGLRGVHRRASSYCYNNIRVGLLELFDACECSGDEASQNVE